MFGSQAVFVQLTGTGKYFPLFQVKSQDVPQRSLSWGRGVVLPVFHAAFEVLHVLRLLPPGGLYCTTVFVGISGSRLAEICVVRVSGFVVTAPVHIGEEVGCGER